jgi:hypothetical protein
LLENNIEGFTEEQITTELEDTAKTVPQNCFNFERIVYPLTAHNLIFNSSPLPDLADNYQSVRTGDVDTTWFKDKNFDPYFHATNYGKLAQRLLLQCAKSKIGVIR